MDGENMWKSWKTLLKWDDFGGFSPYFWFNTHFDINKKSTNMTPKGRWSCRRNSKYPCAFHWSQQLWLTIVLPLAHLPNQFSTAASPNHAKELSELETNKGKRKSAPPWLRICFSQKLKCQFFGANVIFFLPESTVIFVTVLLQR